MQARSAVMLSDSDAGISVAANLARRDVRVACYRRLEDLLREQPLCAIPVLIFHLHERPKGSLLGVIGRLAVEYPGIQKVAMTEAPLSLEVAEYLTSCGVDLVLAEPERRDLNELASVVSRMHERRHRSLAAC